MKILPTSLPGVIHLELEPIPDPRGFFLETFRVNVWAEAGIDVPFVQDNHSRSQRGTLRGLHFQTEPGQAKLVRCVRGEIFDVVVDLRRGSPTYGRWEGFVLDDTSMRQVFAPVGFAHGFCVLSEEADVVYKCSSYYAREHEWEIRYDDPAIGIEWPTDVAPIVSERDASAPTLADVADSLPFRM